MADYFLERMAKQIEETDATLLEIQAGLARAKAQGNDYEVDELLKGYAAAKSQRRDLEMTANEYYQAINKPTPIVTEGERRERSPERMDASDVDYIFSKSKYYSRDMWNNPDIAQRVQQGIAEVQRRKAEGR